jgi:hypothetical protein
LATNHVARVSLDVIMINFASAENYFIIEEANSSTKYSSIRESRRMINEFINNIRFFS